MMKLDQGRFTQNDFAIGNLNSPSSHGDFRTSLSLEQPIFDSSIIYDSKLAGQEENLRSSSLERSREDIAFKTYAACLEVQKAKGYLKAAEEGVVNAREHARLAKVKTDNGVGLKSDELRAKTFLSEMEEQRITAENSLSIARLRLAQLTGGEPGESADLAEEIVPLPVNGDPAELRNRAWESRPDLKEVKLEVSKAMTGVESARAAFLPTLYGTASYQMNDRDIPFGRDNDAWMVGASLRWDIFNGFSKVNEKKKAEALAGAASEYLENFRKEVAIQVEESRLRREEARKRLETARDSVKDGEEAVRLLSRRFENSLATFSELLDAQTALNNARARLIGNESDFALAAARIYYSTGTFLTEVMK
jgi:outer membrane protein TolC